VGVVFEAEPLLTSDGEVGHAAGLVGLHQRDYRAAATGAEG
jgi:hypothetical protein